MKALKQKVLTLDTLNYYPVNPRFGDVGAIAESLDELGQFRTIVVNVGEVEPRLKMTVLAGNHTVKAARALGWDQLSATLVDVDWETAAKIVAADNRTSDLATYDSEVLLELLQTMPDLRGTGYDTSDVDAILADLQTPLSFMPEDTEIPRLDQRKGGMPETQCPECGHVFPWTERGRDS